ncbi:SPOR domain-containing protein [Agitococcus lubricus]|uniref:SPOR domain-containing protein n=1 Tax=Agitococcus lubricus TaxID=1077255 RepID=A0A2T5J0P4_9GAMM|nr:SPOR domain-containing protein [Agitococcus lubricus]PTQ89912.1 hypothetical protein C8N29_105241 [Agitococcus lubricus]
MPLVFGLLVVFNAVFLAWQFFEQQNRSQTPVVITDEQQGQRLQLLTERADLKKEESSDTQESATATTASTPKQNSPSCLRVGPFVNQSMLKHVKATFEKSGFDVKQISLHNQSTNYFVYIPPVSNLDKAQMILADLQKAGISATIVTESNLANAIAIDTVQSSEDADKLKKRVMDLGYRAEARTSVSNQEEQWLLLLQAGDVARAQADRLLVGSPKIRRESVSCP